MVISSRVSRCAAATIAVLAAASLAACGSSGTPSASSSSTARPTASSSAGASTSSPTAPTPAPAGKDRAFGLVDSVSGGTVMVTGPKGPATVDVAPSTRVTQLTAAHLADVIAGECVAVHPTKGSGGQSPVTAAAVLVTQAGDGRCGQAGPRGHGVGGTVASVNGSSIVLTAADNSQVTVTVTSRTRYAKRSTADTSAIAAGQCLMARGTKDGSGNLAATAVNLRPAANGQCGGGGRRHGG
jgi:Domain of unknown function (DUF5666)